MTVKTNPTEARVKHLVESAERAHQHDMHGARDRFAALATETLNTKRVPQADTWRDRISRIGDAA